MQCYHNWFAREDDAPLSASVWPTVSIFYGAEACLEDLGDQDFVSGPNKGSKFHPLLMKEWRELRASGLLPGLDTELFVWQQENANASGYLTGRLYELFFKLAAGRNVIVIQDMARVNWAHEASEATISFATQTSLRQPPLSNLRYVAFLLCVCLVGPRVSNL